jgi:hypothetical protein
VSERWIPILAAIVGLLGGIGGAAIGGSIANEGQKDRFKDERKAELNGLLIDTYSTYLRTAASAYAALNLEEVSGAGRNRVQGDLEGGTGEVRFVTASDQVAHAADRLEQAVVDGENFDTYRRARDRFIRLAERTLIPEPNINE